MRFYFIKKANTIVPLFALLSLSLLFYTLFNNLIDVSSYNKQVNTIKKEISFKVLRNSILLLNFYQPVELYLDYPINTKEFLNWTNLNIKFCKDYVIQGKAYVYFDEKRRCVYFKK